MNHQFFKLPGSWVDIEWSKIWRLSTIRSLGGKLRGHCSCDQAMHTAGSYHHHYVIEHVMCRWPKGFLFYFYLYKTDNCLIIYWIRNHNWHYSLNKQHKTDSLSEWAKHNQLKFAKANLFFFFFHDTASLTGVWNVHPHVLCVIVFSIYAYERSECDTPKVERRKSPIEMRRKKRLSGSRRGDSEHYNRTMFMTLPSATGSSRIARRTIKNSAYTATALCSDFCTLCATFWYLSNFLCKVLQQHSYSSHCALDRHSLT
jgi:hypothetical protein